MAKLKPGSRLRLLGQRLFGRKKAEKLAALKDLVRRREGKPVYEWLDASGFTSIRIAGYRATPDRYISRAYRKPADAWADAATAQQDMEG